MKSEKDIINELKYLYDIDCILNKKSYNIEIKCKPHHFILSAVINATNELINLNPNINYLYICNIGLTDLDLDCDLTELKIQYLSLNDNELTKIPKLPNTLIGLKCDFNKVIELPKIPNNLTHLSCEDNDINKINYLPETLIYLNCEGNNLSSLPELSPDMIYLNCWNNDLPYNNLDEYIVWKNRLTRNK